MASLSELKNETTLAHVAENPEGNLHWLMFAVIIDVSEPTKLEESKNYITKLKVVDPSFNYKEELKLAKLKFHKFVHVNVFTETPEEAPKVTFIGDIIRLRRFRFKYTSKGELMGNDTKYANWLVYSGRKGDAEAATSFKKFAKNRDRPLTDYEKSRLADLRAWNDSFFFKHSLKYISWWNDLRETHDAKKKGRHVYEQVDLVLKCRAIDHKRNAIEFVDKDGAVFTLAIKDTPSIKAAQIIKLRCVIVTVDVAASGAAARAIKLSNLSSCLLLPSNSWDFRQFDKAAQEAKKSPAKSVKADALPFQAEYALPDKKGPKKGHYATAVKKAFAARKPDTAAALLKALDAPAAHHGARFVVDGFVAGFTSTDPAKIIKKIGVDDKKVYDLKDDAVKDKRAKVIFHFVMQVRDESLESSDRFLNVYVLTGEYESRLFDAWKLLPPNDDLTGWKNVRPAALADFEKRLNALKNPDTRVKLVLELMITKSNKPFLRLVDTVFV